MSTGAIFLFTPYSSSPAISSFDAVRLDFVCVPFFARPPPPPPPSALRLTAGAAVAATGAAAGGADHMPDK
eukprot:9474116-Pyramimonas_sp.AAC.1